MNQITEFVQNNIGITYAIGWSFLIVAFCELAKPYIKRFVPSKWWSKALVRSMPFVVGAGTGPLFADNITMELFEMPVSAVASIFIGFGAGFSAQGLYSAFEEVKPFQLLKLKLYKVAGVEVESVDGDALGLDGDSLVEASYAEDE